MTRESPALQGTLLTIAIAFILALIAALAGPFIVDWNNYRGVIEQEVSRAAGLDVRIGGKIDARLLPSPRLALADVSVGGVPMRTLTVELSLGAAMRGEWRATDIVIDGPRFETGVDANGRLALPSPRPGFDGKSLTIERLRVDDGKAVFTDAASGARVEIEKVWFAGDARSLAGPYRGEGAFTRDGALYPFRLNVTGSDNGVRVRLNIDPVDQPLNFEADGEIMSVNGAPRFEGSVGFVRPVQLVAAARSSPAQIAPPQVAPPWRASARLKATPASVLLEQIEFQYGQEDQGVKLTGAADLKFGAQPRLEGVLSARQIDLDRALANPDGSRLPAAAALRTLAEASAGAMPIPMRLGIGIDSVTLGGTAVTAVRGDLESSSDGWRLSGFEFRAPGFSRVQLAGRLTAQAKAVAFNGTADIDSTDLKALVAWLEGRADVPPGPVRALKARGEVTLGSERLAVDRLRAELDRDTIEGRIAYSFAKDGQPARLDADLRASELDVDRAQGFLQAVFAGSTVERPQDIALTLDVTRASVAGTTARDVKARLRSNKDGIDIERLAVGDLGGAAVTAGGKIALLPATRGNLTVDIDARDLAGIAALAARYAPPAAPALRRLSGASKLRAALALDAGKPGMLTVTGNAGALRVNLSGEARGDVLPLDALNGRVTGRIETDDGTALIKALGLDAFIAPPTQAGRLIFAADGKLFGEMAVDAQLAAGALEATVKGAAVPFSDKPAIRADVAIRNVDARPLVQSAAVVPATLSGNLAWSAEAIALKEASGSLAGSNWRGTINVTPGQPLRVEGEVAADTVNAAAILSALAGMPGGGGDTLPVDPFRPGLAAGYQGRVSLKSQRTQLGHLTLRDLDAALTVESGGMSFDNVTADLGGGRFTGRLTLRRGVEGLRAQGRFALSGSDAAALLPPSAHPAIGGKIIADAEFEGAGLSPSALIGSLKGGGRVALENGKFAALDPQVFGAITQAVDRGLPVDGVRIRDAASRALDAGDLSLRTAKATLEIASGQARLRDVTAETGGDAALALNGGIDLTQGVLDARLTLSGPAGGAANRPDIFVLLRGPWSAPARTVDVSALAGWLALRAVDIQAKKLEAIERAGAQPAVRPQGNGELPSIIAPEPAPAPPKPRIAPKPAPRPAVPLQLSPRN